MLEHGTREASERYPKFEPLADTLDRVWNNIKNRGSEPAFKSNLTFLDKGTFGIDPSNLMTIAARPGVGKTALACQLALEYAKQEKRVAFLSLEMTKETILERMFCIEMKVDAFKLRTGQVTEQVEGQYQDFILRISKTRLEIIDDYCHSQEELYTLIEHLNYRPDIIFLDHIQHIRSKNHNSMWETLTEYLRYLKEIAMRHKIAIVALSQINRQGEDKPTLANLKGSGGIEEMSDYCLLMHKLEEPEMGGANFKIAIAKNRFGPVGCYDLEFRENCMRFYDR